VTRTSYSVDWITHVHGIAAMGEGISQKDAAIGVRKILADDLGLNLAQEVFSELEPLARGRAPYFFGWRDIDKGISIFASGKLNHFTVEHSGKGIRFLERQGLLDDMLYKNRDRVSRIDIAVDIEDWISPSAFAADRDAGRFKTYSDLSSPSGVTCYVGSMHSDRYARVYRYNPPHPRAHLLRVEHVFRRDNAKQVAFALCVEGIEAVVAGSWRDFGWLYPMADLESVAPADLTTFRPERKMGSTLRWLIKVAAPSFKRLVGEGIIENPEQFLIAYFMPDEWQPLLPDVEDD
jgi:hypothetical protein